MGLSLLKNGLRSRMQDKLVEVSLATLGKLSFSLAGPIQVAHIVIDTKGLSRKKIHSWNVIFAQISLIPGVYPTKKDH